MAKKKRNVGGRPRKHRNTVRISFTCERELDIQAVQLARARSKASGETVYKSDVIRETIQEAFAKLPAIA